jgi:hypothetical protein
MQTDDAHPAVASPDSSRYHVSVAVLDWLGIVLS